MMLHPQRRIAEQPADDKGKQASCRESHDERRTLPHEDRNRIGADPDEGALRQRNLPRIAKRQIEPERRDGDHRPVTQQIDARRPQEERRKGEKQGDNDAERGARPDGKLLHTVRSSSRPSRPCGRTSRIIGNAPRYCAER